MVKAYYYSNGWVYLGSRSLLLMAYANIRGVQPIPLQYTLNSNKHLTLHLRPGDSSGKETEKPTFVK